MSAITMPGTERVPVGWYSKQRGDDVWSATSVQSDAKIDRNRVIFWQGETRASEVQVIDGVVRAVHLLPNGERTILAFFWPGDVILSFSRLAQLYTAEAVTDCRLVLRRADRDDGAEAGSQIIHEMLDLLQGVSRRTALSRLAWMLIRMHSHLPFADPARGIAWFLIPRGDIADHLGLSVETVSRGLTELKNAEAIDMPSRATIRFRSMPKLMAIAEG